MTALIGFGAVAVAATALLVGNPGAAVATLGMGGIALVVEAKDGRRRRMSHAILPAIRSDRDHAWQGFEREVRRGRRYGHCVSLVRLAPCDGVDEEGAAQAVREALRTTDFCFASDGAVHVVMPETSRMEARFAAERLHRHASSRQALCEVTVATFPDDALTVRGLLERTASAGGGHLQSTATDKRAA